VVDSEKSAPGELERLEAENRALRGESLTLRQFIDSMQNLMDAVEGPKNDKEILDLLGEILENARRTIGAEDGSLLVLDDETDELVFAITQGGIPEELLRWRRLPAGEGIAAWVIRNRRATIANNPHEDTRFYQELDRELEFKTTSILAAPIVGGGRVLGVIELLNKKEGKVFSASDQGLLTLLCRFAGELLHALIHPIAGDNTAARLSQS
jgi:signal transduction protein with GAF and PtsI domain